jgi:hypothetical protein
MWLHRAALAAVAVLLLASCQPLGGVPGSTTPADVPTAIAAATLRPGPTSESSASASPVPAASPMPTASTSTATPSPELLAPPPPTAVTITMKGRDNPDRPGSITTTVTWKEAVTKGTEIRVYGVTACFAPPTGGPCLVEHTPLPSSVRDLIARAPASQGKVSWSWPIWDDIGDAVMANGSNYYEAIVVAAYNAAGHSKFIIVVTSEYCPACTY